MPTQEKIANTGKKKILALDGGGIRGMITVEILGELENMLRRELDQDEDFVLADYFDYISGTSTGAIIAAALSLGWPVDKIRRFYVESGEKMFDKANLLKRFKYKYEDEALREILLQEFGEQTTLGSPELKTLLMMVMRNASTDSPWPISNNPEARFNDPGRTDCNLNIPLWQLVRASTAAPVYFPPEKVSVGDQDFVFVDGGITMYNNPSFQTFLMATLEPYNLCWDTGEDRMLIVSVGTGTSPAANLDLAPGDMNLLYNASSIPSALMCAALNEQDLLCRTFGKCLHGDELDLEVGDLICSNEKPNFRGPVNPRLFTYLRFNAELTEQGLSKLNLGDLKPEKVQRLDSVEYIDDLQAIGHAVASEVKKGLFSNFL